ncbi:hypothetical protein Hanom_Chr07g00622801 [Helianthus anomalus]
MTIPPSFLHSHPKLPLPSPSLSRIFIQETNSHTQKSVFSLDAIQHSHIHHLSSLSRASLQTTHANNTLHLTHSTPSLCALKAGSRSGKTTDDAAVVVSSNRRDPPTPCPLLCVTCRPPPPPFGGGAMTKRERERERERNKRRTERERNTDFRRQIAGDERRSTTDDGQAVVYGGGGSGDCSESQHSQVHYPVDDGDDGGHTVPPCGGGSRNGCCGSSLVWGLICYGCDFWFGSGHSSVSGLGQRQSTSQRFGSSLVRIGQLVSVRVFGSTRSTRLTQSNQSVNSASQLS